MGADAPRRDALCTTWHETRDASDCPSCCGLLSSPSLRPVVVGRRTPRLFPLLLATHRVVSCRSCGLAILAFPSEFGSDRSSQLYHVTRRIVSRERLFRSVSMRGSTTLTVEREGMPGHL